jgi:hypothetical protein
MGLDVEVGQIGPPGQVDGRELESLAGSAAAFEQVGDRRGPLGLTFESLRYGGAQLFGAIAVEQLQQPSGLSGCGFASGESGFEEYLALRSRSEQAL